MKNRIIIAGLGLVALTFLGAGCAGTEVTETTNSSAEIENVDAVMDSEVTTETANQNINGEAAENVNKEDTVVEIAIQNANVNGKVVVNANEEDAAIADENTEIDTSDWLIYTNEEYGIGFTYPDTWGVEHIADCFQVMSSEVYEERQRLLEDLAESNSGTDAVPGNEISICVHERNLNKDTNLVEWANENTYRYVDEEYRGEATFNEIPAYLITDLDFGKSNNYFVLMNGIIHKIYYQIVEGDKNHIINTIVNSITIK